MAFQPSAFQPSAFLTDPSTVFSNAFEETAFYRGASGGYTLTANTGRYQLNGQSAVIARSRTLSLSNGSYSISGSTSLNIQARSPYPTPYQVQAGVTYGPTGVEFTGVYVDPIRLELSTGALIKPIGSNAALIL